jgi:hypothetical protein
MTSHNSSKLIHHSLPTQGNASERSTPSLPGEGEAGCDGGDEEAPQHTAQAAGPAAEGGADGAGRNDAEAEVTVVVQVQEDHPSLIAREETEEEDGNHTQQQQEQQEQQEQQQEEEEEEEQQQEDCGEGRYGHVWDLPGRLGVQIGPTTRLSSYSTEVTAVTDPSLPIDRVMSGLLVTGIGDIDVRGMPFKARTRDTAHSNPLYFSLPYRVDLL